MNSIEHETTIPIERLLFRRQFLLGPAEFIPNPNWSSVQLLKGLVLSVHNDLRFATIYGNEFTATLIGIAVDPYNPQSSEEEILRHMTANSIELSPIIESMKSITGRWVLILQTENDTYLFSDPCGFRQVFYYRDGERIWCASQPELIKTVADLRININENLIPLLIHPGHVRRESQWVGPTTIYEGCFHLMPNHYLSLENMEQNRFYPEEPLRGMTTPDIVETASTILRGTMTALTLRYKLSLVLTAGWDSRVLLAASKNVSKQIVYFVYRHSDYTSHHADIRVPGSITKKLGLDFNVKHVNNHLPGFCFSSFPKCHMRKDSA